jgi:biotin/methionine sulfoxide reductase
VKDAALRYVMHASHWGAYRVISDGRQVRQILPFEHDPNPNAQIHAVKDWQDPRVRITQPMVRAEWLRHRHASDGAQRGQGSFVTVSWDHALDLVADEISRVKAKYSPSSIFAGSYGWCSAGRIHHAPTLLKRMLNLNGGCTRHVDTYSIAAGAVMLDHVLGNDDAYMGRATSWQNIAEHSELLLVFGGISNRTAQSEAGGIARHLLPQWHAQLAARQVRVVLISPCRDDAPVHLNVDWWPIRPGTDTALMLALAHEIVVAGDHDQVFLATHCSGSAAFLDSLTGRNDGVVKSAEWAAAITGLDAVRIRQLARELTRQRSFITVSWGLQRAQHGEQPFWAAAALAAVIGQIGLPGGGMGCGYASLGGVGNAYTRTISPAMPPGNRPLQSFIPVSRITEALERPGEAFEYRGNSHIYPELHMIYWAGGNPYHHHQDLNRLRRAWARPQTVVVQEPFWTATAKMADIVLPASTSLERNDISGNKRSDYLVAMQKAVEPYAQSRPDYEIFCDLAERLGVHASFSEGRDEMAWIAYAYEQVRSDAQSKGLDPLPPFDLFWEQGYAVAPSLQNWLYLDKFRENPQEHPLPTESGRIVLGSRLLTTRQYVDCPSVPSWIEPQEWLGGECARKYPFHLLSRQPESHLHSQLDFSAHVQSYKAPDGREWVSIHPGDAAEFGIAEGALVRLFNGRGACLARARLTADLAPHVLILPTGAWLSQRQTGDLELAGNPNVLTLDIASSSFGQGCAAHTCLVAIEPYHGPEALASVVFSLPAFTSL